MILSYQCIVAVPGGGYIKADGKPGMPSPMAAPSQSSSNQAVQSPLAADNNRTSQSRRSSIAPSPGGTNEPSSRGGTPVSCCRAAVIGHLCSSIGVVEMNRVHRDLLICYRSLWVRYLLALCTAPVWMSSISNWIWDQNQ